MSQPGRKAIVIGAGPMGLATAHYLQQRGFVVQVFEADDRIGGMSAQFDFDGLPIERYYHFLCKTDAPLMSLLDELGLSSLLTWRTTKMGFYYDGAMYDWGRPDALLAFPHLKKRDKLRYALHILRSRSMRDWRSLDNVESTAWIRRWLGDRAYTMLWERSFELKFFEHHKAISAAWVATRIRRVSMSRRDAFHEEMGYLQGGCEALLQGLKRSIEQGGGNITLSAPVHSVVSEAGKVIGVRVPDGLHTAELVVSTVPIQLLPDIVPDLTPAEVQTIRAIQNIGVVCVKVKLPEPFTPYFWVNINDERIGVPGIIEYTNLNPLPSSVVYVPYYMPPTHPRWTWTDQQIRADAISVLQTLRPDWDADSVQATHVSRYRYAQPICGPGFADALPPIRTSIQGLLIADTSFCYPEDRSISESVRIALKVVQAAVTS